MMRFDGEQVGQDYEKQFGKPLKDITVGQLWWIIKLAKHVRGRCRSNAALHNYLARTFPQFRFSTMPATTKDGRPYEKLIISGESMPEEDSDE